MRAQRIENLLNTEFAPIHISVENESHNHSVPKNSETHFKLIVVSDKFQGQTRIERQRQVNALLKTEFDNGLHALTMRLYTNKEWMDSDEGKSFHSPNCHGGSKS